MEITQTYPELDPFRDGAYLSIEGGDGSGRSSYASVPVTITGVKQVFGETTVRCEIVGGVPGDGIWKKISSLHAYAR